MESGERPTISRSAGQQVRVNVPSLWQGTASATTTTTVTHTTTSATHTVTSSTITKNDHTVIFTAVTAPIVSTVLRSVVRIMREENGRQLSVFIFPPAGTVISRRKRKAERPLRGIDYKIQLLPCYDDCCHLLNFTKKTWTS